MKIRELKALIADMHDDAVVTLRSVDGEAVVFDKEDADLYDVTADIDTSAGEPEDDLLVLRVGLSVQGDDRSPLPR